MLKGTLEDLDYFRVIKESRRLQLPEGARAVRIAVFGDCAIQQFVQVLRVLFSRQGIDAQILEAEHDTLHFETLSPSSAYFGFGARWTLILQSVQALRDWYFMNGQVQDNFAEQVADEIIGRWDRVNRQDPTTILLQTNYVLPLERLYGDHDLKVRSAWRTVVSEINVRLTAAALERTFVRVVDAEYTAAAVGKESWFDEKLWIVTKAFCAIEHLPRIAQSFVDAAVSLDGLGVKCVVTDLDNTLWGGAIGEDGVDGIRLGEIEDGPAFVQYQRFLKALKRRGVLLAVCSKNDPENALLPFQKHPDMVLGEEDIAVFVANWSSKADNLRHIQKKINVGFDSIVFIDDDPFERNLIRRELPDVIVPEVPQDPAEVVSALCRLNLFETGSVSEEDAERTERIRSEAGREQLKSAAQNVPDYLRSLDIHYTLDRFDAFRLPRIAQLIQRSNQFNLTTRRYTQGECGTMMEDRRNCLPFYIELKDRFGDSGLISVVVLEFAGDAVEIAAWLMSCRVLMRGVEDAAMNFVFETAKERGLKMVRGTYLPTPKNRMVEKFYAGYGFRIMEGHGGPGTRWELPVSGYQPRPLYMTRAVSHAV